MLAAGDPVRDFARSWCQSKLGKRLHLINLEGCHLNVVSLLLVAKFGSCGLEMNKSPRETHSKTALASLK